jgi:hypothetical protein
MRIFLIKKAYLSPPERPMLKLWTMISCLTIRYTQAVVCRVLSASAEATTIDNTATSDRKKANAGYVALKKIDTHSLVNDSFAGCIICTREQTSITPIPAHFPRTIMYGLTVTALLCLDKSDMPTPIPETK